MIADVACKTCDSNRPSFVLYGIYGVYNYGCEAMVRGTESILRQVWPDAEIRYASMSPEDDRRRLHDTQVKVIASRPYRKFSLRNVLRKASETLPWDALLRASGFRFVDGADIAMSIGGDLYTLLPDGSYNKNILRFGDYAVRRGKPVVLWGASVGPFDQDSKIERLFAEHLKLMSLITSREPASTAYLSSIGVEDNVVECADPAFVVRSDVTWVPRGDGKLRIGMNFSPLATRSAGEQANTEVIAGRFADTISAIIRELDAEVVLLPHVVNSLDESDDDLRFLKSVARLVRPEVSGRLSVVDDDPGFLGVKKVITQCDLVVAARMHCAVNAMAAGVPTILVSYSQKSVGMAQYVYGHTRWVVPVQDVCANTLLPKITDMLSQREDLARHFACRLPEIQADARRPVEALARLLPLLCCGN